MPLSLNKPAASYLHNVAAIRANKTPPCRVLRSFEPAFAGWVPPQLIRLGLSLSRHTTKIGTRIKSVGSKPGCGITRTAGYLTYTTIPAE